MYCTSSSSIAMAVILGILNLAFGIICSIAAYATYRTSVVNEDAYMVARHPKLTFSLMILNVCDLIILQPIQSSVFFSFIFIVDSPSSSFFFINSTIASILTDIRFICLGLLFMARIWLLIFDYQFNKCCVDLLWQTNKNSQSFFLRTRSTFGSTKYVITFTIICIVFCLFIVVIFPALIILAHIIEPEYDSTFLSMWTSVHYHAHMYIYILEAFVCFILLFLIRSIDEKFQIRTEIIYILLIPGTLSTIYVISDFANDVGTHFDGNYCGYFYFYSMFMLFIVSSTILIQSWFVVRLTNIKVTFVLFFCENAIFFYVNIIFRMGH